MAPVFLQASHGYPARSQDVARCSSACRKKSQAILRPAFGGHQVSSFTLNPGRQWFYPFEPEPPVVISFFSFFFRGGSLKGPFMCFVFDLPKWRSFYWKPRLNCNLTERLRNLQVWYDFFRGKTRDRCPCNINQRTECSPFVPWPLVR